MPVGLPSSGRATGRRGALERGCTASRGAPRRRVRCSRSRCETGAALAAGAVATGLNGLLSCGRALTFAVGAPEWIRVATGACRVVLTAGTALWIGTATGREARASLSVPRREAAAGRMVTGRLLRGAGAAGTGDASLTGSATPGSAGVGCGDGSSTLTGEGGAATGGSASGGGGSGTAGRAGSRPSGSTYPFGSAARRTPRWTCGCEVTASLLSPTVPTAAPSVAASPRATLVEPSWSSVTA
jgi:hypothetical protein